MADRCTRRTALAATLALALWPIAAHATKRFAVVSVENETTATLTISYRWGEDEWRQAHLGPGNRHWFSFRYPHPDADRSPEFSIRFDSDTSPSRYAEAKRLHAFAAEEENFDLGHKYAFRYDGPSRRYIELWDIAAPAAGGSPHPQRID